jgi:NPCBM/NEW2 domain
MRPELLDPLFAFLPFMPFFLGIATAVILSICVPLSVGAARGWPVVGTVGGVCAGSTAFFFGLLGGLPVGGVFCILIVALGDPDRPRRHRHDFDEDDPEDDDDGDRKRRQRRLRKRYRNRGSGGRNTAIVGGSVAGALASAVIVFFLVDHFRHPRNGNDPVDADKGEQVYVPDKQLTTVDPPFAIDPLLERPARPVFLASMTEFGLKLGPWRFGKGEIGDRPGTPIKIANKAYTSGLGTHPPDRGSSRVCYALGGRAETLSGAVALNYTAEASPNNAIFFTIHGDGNELWRSSPFHRGDAAAPFRVDVRGVKVLELRATVPGTSFGFHAVWLNPVIEK